MEAVQKDTAVVIANGLKQGEIILDIVRGKQVGTFITKNGHLELASTADQLADEGIVYALTIFVPQFSKVLF